MESHVAVVGWRKVTQRTGNMISLLSFSLVATNLRHVCRCGMRGMLEVARSRIKSVVAVLERLKAR